MEMYGKERVHLNLARLKKGGSNFEIDVDPDLALKFKQGENIDIREVVKADKIFFDAQKGQLASEDRMKAVFDTIDPYEIAKQIIQHGEIQMSAEFRAKLREQKKKKVFEIIHRNAIDPRTNAPIPLQRLENAFEEAKVRIDEKRKAEDQIQEILDKLKPILPIRFEKKQIVLIIPAQHAAKTYSVVKSLSTILKEEWKSDGSWEATVEIPGGLEQDLYDKLNAITHGEMETRVKE
ncbi:ribosome assembly factor SBDS [Nanoarchaeota archaeon]